MPTVSVCIPVYNARDFIGIAIRSVLDQSFPDFELLVLDNCSTDGTREEVSRFRDPRLRYVRNERNLGMEGNFNRALERSAGEFVKILCADDVLYPQCLEKQVAVLAGDTGKWLAMVNCGRDIVDARGRKVLVRSFPGRAGVVKGKEVIRKTVLAGTNIVGEPSAVLFRKAVSERAGHFDATNLYLIDLDYWVRMLREGDLGVLREPLCAFRVSEVSTSPGIAFRQSSDFAGFVDRCRSDPALGIGRIEAGIGKAMAVKNMLLRQVFYRIYASRKKR